MPKRFTCLICRNEIAEPGAECPYCRGRSMIAEGASPRILAAVFCVMAAVFVLTGLYASSFKQERHQRGRLHFEAAETEMAAERYDEAATHYRDALLYSRDDPTYRLGLSRALFAVGRYSESENHLATARVDDPTSGIVNLLLAQLAVKKNQVDEAVSYYRTAIHGRWDDRTDEDRIDMRIEFADFLESVGRDALLTAELMELAEILPRDLRIRTRLANQYLKDGLYEQATSMFRSVIDAEPRNRAALIGRGNAEFHLHNYLTARTQYNRAQMYGSDETTVQQIELCNRILELDPNRVDIGIGERLRRSHAVVTRALAAVASCRYPSGRDFVGPPGPWPEPEQALIDRAEAVLRDRNAGSSNEEVAANLSLAGELWTLAVSLCDPVEQSDEPLAHVIAKAER